jgi:hypothetical protein
MSLCTCDIKALFSYGCSCGGAALELAAERARRAKTGDDKIMHVSSAPVVITAAPGVSSLVAAAVSNGGHFKWAGTGRLGGGTKGSTYRTNGVTVEFWSGKNQRWGWVGKDRVAGLLREAQAIVDATKV